MLVIPDVDAVIVALILASQATYLGKKYNERSGPIIDRLLYLKGKKDGQISKILIAGHNLDGEDKAKDLKIGDKGIATTPSPGSNDMTLLYEVEAGEESNLNPAAEVTLRLTIGGVIIEKEKIKSEEAIMPSIEEVFRVVDGKLLPGRAALPERNQTIRIVGSFILNAAATVTLLPPIDPEGNNEQQREQSRKIKKQMPTKTSDDKQQIEVVFDLSDCRPGKWALQIQQFDLDSLTAEDVLYVGTQVASTKPTLTDVDVDANNQMTLTGTILASARKVVITPMDNDKVSHKTSTFEEKSETLIKFKLADTLEPGRYEVKVDLRHFQDPVKFRLGHLSSSPSFPNLTRWWVK